MVGSTRVLGYLNTFKCIRPFIHRPLDIVYTVYTAMFQVILFQTYKRSAKSNSKIKVCNDDFCSATPNVRVVSSELLNFISQNFRNLRLMKLFPYSKFCS